MAVTTTVLKKTRQQAVFKVNGSGADGTFTYLDAMLSDEYVPDPANVVMNITNILFAASDATAGPILVKRDGTTIMTLNGTDNWALSQNFGFAETSNNSANIVVTMPAAAGMVYITVSKGSKGVYTVANVVTQNGFVSPNFNANVK